MAHDRLAQKQTAIRLRKDGWSIRSIEKKLRIPRSTLSGWLRDISLTESQKRTLRKNWQAGLVNARAKAAVWHRAQKQQRLRMAEAEALHVLRNVNIDDVYVLELALAVLYLGEGFKKNLETGMGSSDPQTLRFFLFALKKVYNLDPKKVRCELYLRADQDPQATKRFWSRQLRIPVSNFKQANVDQRTLGTKTHIGYNGVCSLRCGNVAIQRRLVYLAKAYFSTLTE